MRLLPIENSSSMSTSKPKHHIPKNIPDPNWSFKTKIFPNFSRVITNPTIKPLDTLKRKSPHSATKPPPKRVSFNLTPKLSNRSSVSTSNPTTDSSSLPTYLPNFIYSHTLNPTSSRNQITTAQSKNDKDDRSLTGFLNPLTPPKVKLTKQLVDNNIESRYVMSRLRDHKIYNNVRLYLAYLHNKPDSICFEGKTNTNLKVLISQEGLPIEHKELMQIFVQFHEGLAINSTQVAKDLSSFASFISSKRISHLHKSRNDVKNYYRP